MARKNMGSFGSGFADGVNGGMKMAKQFQAAMAAYRKNQIASSKAKLIEDDTNAGATDAPLGKVPAIGSESIVPETPITETAPVEMAQVDAKPLDDGGAEFADQWNSSEAPDAPAVDVPATTNGGL